MTHYDLINQMTLEEKCSLLSEEGNFVSKKSAAWVFPVCSSPMDPMVYGNKKEHLTI